MALSSGAAGAASSGGTQHPHEMATRKIPSATNNESVPVIGMGTWNTFDVSGSSSERAPLQKVLEVFYAAGARLIDSSPMYANAEGVTGDLVQKLRIPSTRVFCVPNCLDTAPYEPPTRGRRTSPLRLLSLGRGGQSCQRGLRL